MREICIDDFLTKSNPNNVERHSDTSDFESPRKIPIVASRGGNHKLLCQKTSKRQEINRINKQASDMTEIYNGMICNEVKKQTPLGNNRMPNVKTKQCDMKRNIQKNLKNKGDEVSINNAEKVNSRSFIRNVMPGLSTIFRRRNEIKQISKIEESQKTMNKDCDRYCANCERRRIKSKELSKHHKGYLVQPVYTVEDNAEKVPFLTNNILLNELSATSKHNCIERNWELNVSSESELENIINYKHKAFKKRIQDSEYKKRFEKEVKKEYVKYKAVKNEQQQYPSKFQLKPYQVFASSSCQAKCSSSSCEIPDKMPSSSSSFWDYLAKKMKSKIQKPGVSKSCDCIKAPGPCSPENCKYIDPLPNPDYDYNRGQLSKTSSWCPQINQHSSQSSTSSKKKIKTDKVVCKCYSKKKRKSQSKQESSQDDDTKPCQEGHDNITRAISEKYNGEILCIHNPPCILINGCLNLPPPKTNIQGNLWPVTQSKKSSFCRKMKRKKQKSCEQSCQYHPPCIDLQECLPEFKTEKLIQSICNHDPPCEVVHGCYKVQYDPKLQNSCVHVPMCQNLPECFLYEQSKDVQKSSCHHSPKCTKFPICSRKYITLTAKEDVGVQVVGKTKIVCRHRPHCLMIPRCLAQAINGDYIPFDAIPGCIHQPCCDLVPACCRKSAKEFVSGPAQYPNGCRIV